MSRRIKELRDTPGVSVSKKKAPTKADRSKGIEILSDVALLEVGQLKEATKRSNKGYYISQASGSGDGTDFESRVPDEQQCKTSSTDEGTGTKLGVPDVPTYDFESENESCGDSEDDNDDDSDDDNKGDHDKANSDNDGNSDADDNERTYSDDDDESSSFTLKDYDKEEHDDEYETNDHNENVFEEEDDDLYKDVDVRSLGAEQEKERKGNEEMTDDDQNVSQENKFLILENVPPSIDEVASTMNVKIHQEESSTQEPSLFTVPKTAILETATAHTTTAPPTISMITPLPQLTTPSSAPTTVPSTTSIPVLPNFSSMFGFDQRVSTLETELSQLKQADHSTQLREFVKSLSYTKEFEKKAQEERKLYIDMVEKSVKDIIKNERCGIQRQKKAYSLKRSREDKDKDEDPPVGPNQGLNKKKTSKDAEPSRGSKSKESKSSSSKGSKAQSKSSGKSAQEEEPVFETDQGGNIEDQPNVEATPMNDWFKKPERPLTPNLDWIATKSVDSRPPQKWLSRIDQVEKPPLTFDEMMSTHIDFSAYVMHNLKIDNLIQEILVGPAFNLLKGTCKSFVELEYHFEECYKDVTGQVDWNNPEGQEYLFDLSKPLSLTKAQGRQVVPADYFFNNDLEYLKGRSSSRKYTNSTTKTKADKYDNIEGIKDMVPTLWSPVKVDYDKFEC
ncbi:hypothetical protein Tco_0007826 [Tanacetum coccineum]